MSDKPKTIGTIFKGHRSKEHFEERFKILADKYERSGLSPDAKNSQLCKSDCACGGSGWFREHIKDVTNEAYGKLIPCPGVNKAANRSHNSRSGLLPYHYGLNWSSIKLLDDPTKKAVATLNRFINRGYGLLYLHGPHGNAKSEILLIFTAVAIRAGLDATYYPAMEDLLVYIKEGFDRGLAESRVSRLEERKVLVIDEFDDYSKPKGSGESGWADQTVSRLFKYREVMANRGELITVLASNEPPSSRKYDPSIIDRFNAHDIVHMTAGSKRGINKKEN